MATEVAASETCKSEEKQAERKSTSSERVCSNRTARRAHLSTTLNQGAYFGVGLQTCRTLESMYLYSSRTEQEGETSVIARKAQCTTVQAAPD